MLVLKFSNHDGTVCFMVPVASFKVEYINGDHALVRATGTDGAETNYEVGEGIPGAWHHCFVMNSTGSTIDRINGKTVDRQARDWREAHRNSAKSSGGAGPKGH